MSRQVPRAKDQFNESQAAQPVSAEAKVKNNAKHGLDVFANGTWTLSREIR
jgi:hypothetical protein